MLPSYTFKTCVRDPRQVATIGVERLQNARHARWAGQLAFAKEALVGDLDLRIQEFCSFAPKFRASAKPGDYLRLTSSGVLHVREAPTLSGSGIDPNVARVVDQIQVFG